MVSLEFFIDIILPAALWPCSRLSLWQKRVPGIFPGSKGGRCVGLTTLPPSCADCVKIWEPQPPGTLRACQGLQWDCFTFTFTSGENLIFYLLFFCLTTVWISQVIQRHVMRLEKTELKRLLKEVALA
jgi:hypothetical protein